MKMKISLKKKERSFDTKKYNKVSAIVSFMEEHREITPKKAENITGKSAATVRRYFKLLTDTSYIEEGVRNMCRAMEEMRNETYEEAYERAIMVLIKSGELSLEKIASLYEVPLDRVQELALSVQKA